MIAPEHYNDRAGALRIGRGVRGRGRVLGALGTRSLFRGRATAAGADVVTAAYLVPLIPSVTPRLQHRALLKTFLFPRRCARNERLAFQSAAESVVFLPRAAAVLNAAWRPSSERFMVPVFPATALLVLQTLMFFESPSRGKGSHDRRMPRRRSFNRCWHGFAKTCRAPSAQL